MYITMRSPKGGNPLASLWAGVRAKDNIKLDPSKKPEIVEDYIVFKIGYCDKDMRAGDAIFIKRTEAQKLKSLIKNEIL